MGAFAGFGCWVRLGGGAGKVHHCKGSDVLEFVIHEVPLAGGRLAISPMPGRTRHYAADWQRLLDWAPDLVVSMTTQAELAVRGAGTLGDDLAQAGIAWRHMPVTDFGVPDSEIAAVWPEFRAQAMGALAGGSKVLVHCMGGCGRSGMVVLRLMIAAGESPKDALIRLRKVRPCAVETDEQMAWALLG